ncbi:hypothetical protein AVEN_168235-1 [Araneus ventricosus]|uniref:Uncharacterized protein n=1 Tax=Araneus ventricosus TaxID=182803 RepID=A0A4Y2S4F4_ARAVE|nr:hypothetical protein AVEN_231897-1 [Araneus ventricosus]GBN82292.1 hypothetical protein AVEN_168235-1 [Araneus ventricosus]
MSDFAAPLEVPPGRTTPLSLRHCFQDFKCLINEFSHTYFCHSSPTKLEGNSLSLPRQNDDYLEDRVTHFCGLRIRGRESTGFISEIAEQKHQQVGLPANKMRLATIS